MEAVEGKRESASRGVRGPALFPRVWGALMGPSSRKRTSLVWALVGMVTWLDGSCVAPVFPVAAKPHAGHGGAWRMLRKLERQKPAVSGPCPAPDSTPVVPTSSVLLWLSPSRGEDSDPGLADAPGVVDGHS